LSGVVWNRCRTHFTSNLLTKVPRSAQGMVATMVHSIYTHPTALKDSKSNEDNAGDK
jgi:putative transposase